MLLLLLLMPSLSVSFFCNRRMELVDHKSMTCFFTLSESPTYTSFTPVPFFKISTEAAPFPTTRIMEEFTDPKVRSNKNVVYPLEGSPITGYMVRPSLTNILENGIAWTLPAGTKLPSGLAVAMCEYGFGYYGCRRFYLRCTRVPANITKIPAEDFHYSTTGDRWMITTTRRMPLKTFEAAVRQLPWTRVTDGRRGQRPLESTQEHMKYTDKTEGDSSVLLRALADFILLYEAQLSVNPEYWEYILYAGSLRENLIPLFKLRDSYEFEECRLCNFPLCPHTIQMLKKVLHHWRKSELSDSVKASIKRLRDIIKLGHLPINFSPE